MQFGKVLNMKCENILVEIPVSAYRALELFALQLIQAWRELGITIDVIGNGESIAEDIAYVSNKKYDVIFSLNDAFINATVNNQDLLMYLNAPYYTFLVDHPLHLHNRLICQRNREGYICVDSSFANYAEKYYKASKYTCFFQAGIEGKYANKPYDERTKDVVFCGSYRDSGTILANMKKQNDTLCSIWSLMIEQGLKNPNLTIEKMLWNIIKKYQLEIGDEDFAECLSDCRYVELYLRGFYREQVIKNLLAAGISIHVYGDGWENLVCKNRDLLCCHPAIDYMEMLDVFSDAKIVLNVMPWAKNGFHDRIACAMLNGALAVSDSSSYMEEQELDEQKMLLFSLTNMNMLPMKVKYFLESPEEAKKIAKEGQAWARKYHTWKVRASELIDFFES